VSESLHARSALSTRPRIGCKHERGGETYRRVDGLAADRKPPGLPVIPGGKVTHRRR
jgi:hypothetical protein